MMEKLPLPVRIMISTTFKTFKEGPFVTKTVGELMWGYESKLLDFLNSFLPGIMPFKGKFGLFVEVCDPVYCCIVSIATIVTIKSKHLAGKTLNM